ncbi:MAG: chromosome segregation protein SMC [Phycisphaerales bacterium]|nr:MAG: chromosome segregation protein SMC [Phycisphaerales bacterium]
MLLHQLRLKGLLSFGPDSPALVLRPLNVLIGPNGSGKSNVLAAIDLLRSAATKLTAPIRRSAGGGVSEWLWKGAAVGRGEITAIVDYPDLASSLRHSIAFEQAGTQFEIAYEAIEDDDPEPEDSPSYFYRLTQHGAVFSRPGEADRMLHRSELRLDESILSQRKDPDQYPELAHLVNAYGDVRLYREWPFGHASVFRIPQSAALPGDRLEENLSNLGLFLNHLRGDPQCKRAIIDRLRDLYTGLDDFDVRVKGGTVEVFLTEGDFIIPAARLSDGTLRYLCLLAILCDPDPPRLICIEEPELGLHPDLLPKIADLMIAASERTQLIVTTHSDILVDALTEQPESVVVVEKHDGQTRATRLQAGDELQQWLEKYRLGQLWLRGEIGGTRW